MLHDYEVYCRAAGMREATIRLRLRWLERVDRELGLDTATRSDLLVWLSQHQWAPETRRSARSALQSFYRWAVDEHQLELDPAAKLPSVRVPAGVPRPAPTDILQQAINAATDRDRLMIGLAAYAGLRRTEIATLRWDAVSWAGLRIVGKGGRQRQVPVLPRLQEWLDQEQALRSQGLLGTGHRYEPDPGSPYVFPSHIGGPISPFTVGAILSRALGSGWTGHTLRHRFATLAYSAERDLLTVQQLLGHSKPETTARYTAVPEGAALRAVQAAGDAA